MARKARVRVGGRSFTIAQLDAAIGESTPARSRPSIVTSRTAAIAPVTIGRRSIVTRTSRAEGPVNRCRECGDEIPRTRKRGAAYAGDGRPRWYCGAMCRKRASRGKRAPGRRSS